MSTSLSPRLATAGVVVVATVVLLPTLAFGFVYDDHWTLLANGFLRCPEDLAVLLGPGAVERHVVDAFRPTAIVLDMLTYAIFELDPASHHAVSVALHAGVLVLLARWLARLGVPDLERVVAVGLFGVAAIHAEAIAVVSYREDLLAAVLGLAALLAAERALAPAPGRGRAGPLFAAFALSLLACGAKASAAPLPLLWLLARTLSPWQPMTLRRAAVPAVALALGVAVFFAHQLWLWDGLSPYAQVAERMAAARFGRGAVLAASAQIHAQVLVQTVVPFGLSPEHVDRGASWIDPETILCAGGLLAVVVYAVASARSRPIVAIAVLGWVVLALPTANLVDMPNMRADRFSYLPSLPVCLGIAVAAVASGRALAHMLARPLVVIAPACLLAIVHGSVLQAAVVAYKSDSRLWEIALRRAPHSARAHAIAGELVISRMAADDRVAADPAVRARAAGHCAIALRREPELALAHLCAARLAVLDKRWEDAVAAFERALARAPVRADRVLAALASATLDLETMPWADRVARALAHLDRALHDYPYSPEIAAVAARIHHRLGLAERARELYAGARRLRPERWDVVLWGLELELDLGETARARAAWAAAEDLLPVADDVAKDAMRRRLVDAERLFPEPIPPSLSSSDSGAPRHDP